MAQSLRETAEKQTALTMQIQTETSLASTTQAIKSETGSDIVEKL